MQGRTIPGSPLLSRPSPADDRLEGGAAGLAHHADRQPVGSGLAYAPLPAGPTYSATKAALRSFTESLRVQLSETNVQVIDLVPPAVRTTLLDQTDSPYAMPLEEFLSEVMDLIANQPDATQILVERVKRHRFAEADGAHDEILAMLSGRY